MGPSQDVIGDESSPSPPLRVQAARRHYQERESQRRARLEAERQRWLGRVRQLVPHLAGRHPGVQQVCLYGSLLRPGGFRADSDIDLAVACDSLETESVFWRALERELERNVDLRPLTGVIAEVAEREGEKVYG